MHAHYYRIKAAALQWAIAQERLGRELAAAKMQMESELRACELDPSKDYRLNEQTQDVEVVPALSGNELLTPALSQEELHRHQLAQASAE